VSFGHNTIALSQEACPMHQQPGYALERQWATPAWLTATTRFTSSQGTASQTYCICLQIVVRHVLQSWSTFGSCSTQKCSIQAEQLIIFCLTYLATILLGSEKLAQSCISGLRIYTASVPIDLLSSIDVDVMCKGTWPASVSHMQYACTPELKCTCLS